jgi:hypothetical protein
MLSACCNFMLVSSEETFHIEDNLKISASQKFSSKRICFRLFPSPPLPRFSALGWHLLDFLLKETVSPDFFASGFFHEYYSP